MYTLGLFLFKKTLAATQIFRIAAGHFDLVSVLDTRILILKSPTATSLGSPTQGVCAKIENYIFYFHLVLYRTSNISLQRHRVCTHKKVIKIIAVFIFIFKAEVTKLYFIRRI